jgi:hypothetical protein
VRHDRSVPRRHRPAINSNLDDISDAQLAIQHWRAAVGLQHERLDASSGPYLIDINFGVFAVNNVVRACGMLTRHEVDGIAEALDDFRQRQGAATQLRNALEHFDDYHRGQGDAAVGQSWFPYQAHRREDGRLYLFTPPLSSGGDEAMTIDVFTLFDDARALAARALELLAASSAPRLMLGFLDARNRSEKRRQ